jgi:dipeptidyl aminopeptidase/acylaminoacyl peptidase
VRTTLVIMLLAANASRLAAQQAPPNTDVFLAPIKFKDDKLDVGRTLNITSRHGYDNQPSFTPDGKSVLYTSTREDAQADIYRYDRRSKRTMRLTTSAPESEYSATVMPDGKRFSVIRVERDSTQRLWSFDMSGGDARVVILNLKPVGYHVWLDAGNVATYVLGSPNTLYVVGVSTGFTRLVAHDIGRSLVRVPNQHAFTFLQRADSAWWLTLATVPPSGDVKVERLTRMPQGADYLVWTRDGTAVTATGTKLMIWRKGAPSWTEAADLSSQGVEHVTRLALSPDERTLAFVAEPKP